MDIFTKIRQQIDNLINRLNAGTLKPTDIPIKKADYEKFLPTLGTNSGGIGGLISRSGGGSLSSLFNSYDAGDISGGELAAMIFEKYADDILKGLSYTLSLSYTSPNEVAVENAKASQAVAQQQKGAGMLTNEGPIDTNYPMTTQGSRGDFERQIREMDLQGFQGNPLEQSDGTPRPPAVTPTKVGKFDWEARATTVCENVKKAGLNPADFGCLPNSATVSSDYSWRGHTKMVCSRLATHIDPGLPEQMGCPPVSWKGWRL